jgi:hypothetical protein
MHTAQIMLLCRTTNAFLDENLSSLSPKGRRDLSFLKQKLFQGSFSLEKEEEVI